MDPVCLFLSKIPGKAATALPPPKPATFQRCLVDQVLGSNVNPQVSEREPEKLDTLIHGPSVASLLLLELALSCLYLWAARRS